jgi:hypothetical protein
LNLVNKKNKTIAITKAINKLGNIPTKSLSSSISGG